MWAVICLGLMLTLVGVVLMVRYPRTGLWVSILSISFQDITIYLAGRPRAFLVSDFLLPFLAYLAFIGIMVRGKRQRKRMRLDFLDLCIFFFLGAILFSLFNLSSFYGTSVFYVLKIMFTGFIGYVLVRYEIRTPKNAWQFAWVFVGVGASIALQQCANILLSVGQGIPIKLILSYRGKGIGSIGTSWGVGNNVGQLMMVVLPLSIVAVRRIQSASWRWVGYGVLGMMVLSVFVSQSRTAIASLVIAVALWGLLSSRLKTWLFLILLMFSLAIGVSAFASTGMLAPAMARFLAEPVKLGIEDRLDFIRSGWGLFAEHPFVGRGPILGYVSHEVDGVTMQLTVHNLLAHAAVQFGVVGLAVVSLMGFRLLVLVRRLDLKRRGNPELNTLFIGLAVTLAVSLVHAMVDLTYFVEPRYNTLIWAIIGYLLAWISLSKPRRLTGNKCLSRLDDCLSTLTADSSPREVNNSS